MASLGFLWVWLTCFLAPENKLFRCSIKRNGSASERVCFWVVSLVVFDVLSQGDGFWCAGFCV